MTTGASGFAVFSPTFTSTAAYASFSATYTGADGNTSEFTENYPTPAKLPVADLVVQSTSRAAP